MIFAARTCTSASADLATGPSRWRCICTRFPLRRISVSLVHVRQARRLSYGEGAGEDQVMDTIIFLLIFATLLAMSSGRRWLVVVLFLVTLAATLLLFSYHATSKLNLNF